MTIRELFDKLTVAASAVYDPREARAAALFLAERLWGAGRFDIAADPAREVDAAGLERVLKDVGDGRPVQYIAGEAWFCGMWMAVREGVLIPRPETEELVRWVAGDTRAGAAVLDVGTGSGAIAVAIAREVAGCRVTGLDISDGALEVARENARRADVDVEFVKADILGDIEITGDFDLIVSNPPYIPRGECAAMHRNVVDHEPHEALFVPDDDPLLFYRAIASHAGRGALRRGGRLFFEVHERWAQAVAEMLAAAGFRDIEVRRDMNGRDRMVGAIND